MTPRRISRTGVGGSIPINTPIHSEMRKYSIPDSSDNTGTSNNIGTNDNTTAPPCGLNASPKIEDIWQPATPDLIKSNKLDNSIDGKFPDNLVVPPILTDVTCEKISDSSIQDIYKRCWMTLMEDPVNIPASQFVDLGLYTIDALDKSASLWTTSTRVGRPTDVVHWSATDHIFGKLQQLETM